MIKMNTENITIERASADDAEALLNYLKQIGGETDNLTFGAEGLPITVSEEKRYIDSAAASADNIMLVAKHNGKIIGDASLSRLPRRMSHRGDLGIAVLRDYWNTGVGSRLLGEIIRLARGASFEVIDLQVRTDNTAAIRLYEKFGFEKIGSHPSFFKISNSDIPFYYMCLRL